jgi:hypothetical protein
VRGTESGELAVERLDTGGPGLSLLKNAPCQEGETSLVEGNRLVLCSDGLVEVTNKPEEEFGSDRLLKVVSANWRRPPERDPQRGNSSGAQFGGIPAFHGSAGLVRLPRQARSETPAEEITPFHEVCFVFKRGARS